MAKVCTYKVSYQGSSRQLEQSNPPPPFLPFPPLYLSIPPFPLTSHSSPSSEVGPLSTARGMGSALHFSLITVPILLIFLRINEHTRQLLVGLMHCGPPTKKRRPPLRRTAAQRRPHPTLSRIHLAAAVRRRKQPAGKTVFCSGVCCDLLAALSVNNAHERLNRLEAKPAADYRRTRLSISHRRRAHDDWWPLIRKNSHPTITVKRSG